MEREMSASDRLAAMAADESSGSAGKSGVTVPPVVPSSAGAGGTSAGGTGSVGTGAGGAGAGGVDGSSSGLDFGDWAGDDGSARRPSAQTTPPAFPTGGPLVGGMMGGSVGGGSVSGGPASGGSSSGGSSRGGVSPGGSASARSDAVARMVDGSSDAPSELPPSSVSSAGSSARAQASATPGSLDALPEWMRDALQDVPPARAARFASEPGVARLDKAIEGLDLESRVKVLRTVLNLDIRPNDEMMVLLTVFGYITQAATEAPREIRGAVGELRSATTDLSDDMSNFVTTIGDVFRKVSAEVEERSARMATNKVAAVTTEEMLKFRERLIWLMSQVLADHAKSVSQENRRTLGTEWMALAFSGAVVLGSVLLGFFGRGGADASSRHGDEVQARQGRIYATMYGQMPRSMQSWIREWSKGHAVK